MSPFKTCSLVTAWFWISGSASAQPLAVTNEANSRLFSLNPDAGTSMFIGNTGVPGMTDLARSADGSLFGSTFDTLVNVNPTTGAANLVGVFAPVPLNMVGLEFTASGALFGVSASGGVFEINRNTGAATSLFNAGFAFEGDLAHEGGDIYYATATAGAGSRLIALNLLTQSATDRGLIAAGQDFDGLDFAGDGRLLAFSRTGGVYHLPSYATVADGVFLSSTVLPISGVTLTPVPEPSAIALVSLFGIWLSKKRRAVS